MSRTSRLTSADRNAGPELSGMQPGNALAGARAGAARIDLNRPVRRLPGDLVRRYRESAAHSRRRHPAVSRDRIVAGDKRAAYPALLPCPRCTTPLSFTQDLQHTTRFTYYRCRYGHGRFTPFVQFLREKNFIRALDPKELERLRAVVTTVRCVSCGAPVPLERSAVCPYCGAPVMLLDPDAVQHALDRLDAAEMKRIAPQPMSGDALIAIANVERELAKSRRDFETESGVDLLKVGLHALRVLL
jgi:endogenous inhibitor of DNA gyrase (YacG/DUF329 family)